MPEYRDNSWQDSMRIRFDYSNVMVERVGQRHGLTNEDLDAHAEQCRVAHEALQAKRGTGWLEWTELPYQEAAAQSIIDYAGPASRRFANFAVLGIGGSALGPIAVHNALTHPYYNLVSADARGGRPRFFVLDNVDPDLIAGFCDVVPPEETLFNVITKSGSTAETMAQLLIFRDLLRRKLGASYGEHIVATTDPNRGDLRRIATAEGWQTFPIQPGVGGRFSELSAVGLLPAAMVGIDVAGLLAGAAYADQICRESDFRRNPAYIAALLGYIAYQRARPISVFMPYSQQLRYIADWYRQLWAESLGKRLSVKGEVVNIGPTPLNALGVTDQHSMLQLFQEGPYDKVINFVVVERYGREVTIPAGLPEYESAAYLGGRTLNELMLAEQQGVEIALTESERPNCKHIVPEVNAFTVGQLLYMLEVQTAFAGELFGIDAFDQPGVEGGKIATYALMGRPGYEQERRRIEARAIATASYVT